MDPPPADHTPSGRPRPAPPALRSVPLPLHSASLTSLQSWRLPDLLFLSGISDDHDRLGTRRSSSAGSARRAVLRHRAPRTEGWHRATPQTTPTARRFAPPPAPSGGGQCRAIGPAGGIGKYPSGLFWGVGDLLGCGANVETAVAPRGHAEQARAPETLNSKRKKGDVPKRAPRVRRLA